MKAVIYARYSSDNQREESIDGQLRECKKFAEYNGITIIGEYIDRAFSAKTDNRPEFQRMIKDSYKSVFDTVIGCIPSSGRWGKRRAFWQVMPSIAIAKSEKSAKTGTN